MKIKSKIIHRVFFLLGIFVVCGPLGSGLEAKANLLKSPIWTLGQGQRLTFVDQGIFHHKIQNVVTSPEAKLNQWRVAFKKADQRERIVLQYGKGRINPLYGKISKEKKKIYIDSFKTDATFLKGKPIRGRFLKSVDVFDLEQGKAVIELNFGGKYSFDIFHLENPGRLVIDVVKPRT